MKKYKRNVVYTILMQNIFYSKATVFFRKYTWNSILYASKNSTAKYQSIFRLIFATLAVVLLIFSWFSCGKHFFFLLLLEFLHLCGWRGHYESMWLKCLLIIWWTIFILSVILWIFFLYLLRFLLIDMVAQSQDNSIR